MKIKPLHNHVVIKQQDETETMYGNIIVPDAGKEKPLIIHPHIPCNPKISF